MRRGVATSLEATADVVAGGQQRVPQCPCGSSRFVTVHTFAAPPKGETPLPFADVLPYRRQLCRCAKCGHFISHGAVPTEDVYRGEYVSATYGRGDGIRAAYDRIMALDPAESDKDLVRFYVGDTDSTWELLQDEEILLVLSQQVSFVDKDTALPDIETYRAAATCADALCAFYARFVDTRNKSLQVSAGTRFDHFKTLARRLWSKAGVTISEDGRQAVVAGLFAGGLTLSGKRALDADTDAVQPAFRRGEDDHPEAIQDGDQNLIRGNN